MRKIIYLFLIIIILSNVCFAQEFPIIGARAMGMGGAFVALADDATATYWNPAAIPTRRLIDINILFDAKFSQTSDLLSHLQDINDLDLTMNPGNAGLYGDILESIDQSNPFLTGGVDYGIFYTNDIFSAGYLETSIITSGVSVDLERLDTSPTNINFVLNNLSELQLRRVKFTEYLFGAGYLLWSEDSFIGVTVKYIQTKVSFLSRELIDEIETDYNEIDYAFEDFSDGEYSDQLISFDAGALFYILPTVRVGVVGKNVLSPSFEISETEELSLKAQWRAGTAIQLTDSIILTGDIDISKNQYFGTDYYYRQFALGAEVGLFESSVFVRAGLNKNTAISDSPLVLCGGVGVRFDSIILDASIQYAPEREALIAGAQVHVFYKEK